MEQSQVLQGRSRLQEKVGQNAGRQTWLAVDLQAEELVIVKLLAFSPQMQWEDFKLFEREAQVLKQLNHPRIPRYRDYFSLDKQVGFGLCWFGLVQDCIEGMSLEKMLAQGRRFSEMQVRSIATQVLEILTYLHELNPAVLHRDIKPSNLILGECDRLYLVDFGAVQQQAAVEGVTFTVVGTAGYAPLEQFWGRAVPASDLYSLGVTLIHLLTGVSPVDLPQKNLRIQFEDKVSLSPNLIGWLSALTAPDLTQRYSRSRDAIADLEANRYLNAPLQQIPQPTGSCIKLWKSPTQLKVEIPGRGMNIFLDMFAFGLKLILAGSSWFSILGFSIVFIGLTLWAMAAIVLIIYNPFASFLSFCILIPMWLLIVMVLTTFSREVHGLINELEKPFRKISNFHLCLNKKYLNIEQELFGWRYIKQRCYSAKIKNVKHIHLKAISIEAGKINYVFGQDLSESERYWLTQEIQDWLLER